jgi:DNA-binding response OmpR family regulator
MKERTHNILVIEDDGDIGNLIKMILEYYGYRVFHLENTNGLHEFIKSNSINIVILDMLLSGLNTSDICIDLKKDASFASVPVIMMSAHPDAESICKSAGADAFVSKPFDLDELLLKIAHFTGIKTLPA